MRSQDAKGIYSRLLLFAPLTSILPPCLPTPTNCIRLTWGMTVKNIYQEQDAVVLTVCMRDLVLFDVPRATPTLTMAPSSATSRAIMLLSSCAPSPLSATHPALEAALSDVHQSFLFLSVRTGLAYNLRQFERCACLAHQYCCCHQPWAQMAAVCHKPVALAAKDYSYPDLKDRASSGRVTATPNCHIRICVLQNIPTYLDSCHKQIREYSRQASLVWGAGVVNLSSDHARTKRQLYFWQPFNAYSQGSKTMLDPGPHWCPREATSSIPVVMPPKKAFADSRDPVAAIRG